MTHKNQAATDYQQGSSFVSDLPVTGSGVFKTGNALMQFTETYGVNYNPGVDGWQWQVINTDRAPFPTNTYEIKATTPFFTYDSGVLTGWAGTGACYFFVRDAVLTVDASCNWTLTFSDLEFWTSINGSTLTMVASKGSPGTLSGSGYDERLNISFMMTSVQHTVPVPSTCPISAIAGGSYTSNTTMTGGYQYKLSGVWTEDPTLYDTSAPSATCLCLAPLPTIGGSGSFHVLTGTVITGSLSQSLGSVPCGPNCTPSSQAYRDQHRSFTYDFTSVKVKGIIPNVLSQTVVVAWDCDNNGTSVSGTTTTTTSTVHTTCSSHREVSNFTDYIACSIPPLVTCLPGSSCAALPAATYCQWDASADLTWPVNPPCQLDITAIDYDWSKSFRHGRISYSAGTGTLWAGVAPNGNPYLWNDYDTAIVSTSAALRWQDSANLPMGILYPTGGSNLGFAQSSDEGHTWSVAITITSSLASGGFFDFEETWDFLRIFYWLEGSSAPYTIYTATYDRQNNLVSGPTATNITSSDLAPIRVRWFTQTGGSQYIGLEYVSGGVLLFVTARDNVNFS